MKKLLAIILSMNFMLSAFGAEIKMSLSKGTITASSATVHYTLTNTMKNTTTAYGTRIKQNGWVKLHILSDNQDEWITIRTISNSTSTFQNNGSYTFTGLEPYTLYIVEWICSIESADWNENEVLYLARESSNKDHHIYAGRGRMR